MRTTQPGPSTSFLFLLGCSTDTFLFLAMSRLSLRAHGRRVLIWAPGTGPGLTGPGPDTDFANIVQADPFWQCTPVPANCPTTIDLTRFTLSDNQPVYYGQASPGGQPLSYSYQYQYSNISTQGKGTSTTRSQEFAIDSSLSGGIFGKITLDFKDSNTLTWTTSSNTSITQTGTTVAQASITPPTCTVVNGACSPVYTGPAEFGIYQDNQYGTFMFFPITGTSGTPLALPSSTGVPSAISGLPYGPEVLTATGGSGTGYTWCVQSGAQCVQSGLPLPPSFSLGSKSSCGNACTEVALISTGNPSSPGRFLSLYGAGHGLCQQYRHGACDCNYHAGSDERNKSGCYHILWPGI